MEVFVEALGVVVVDVVIALEEALYGCAELIGKRIRDGGRGECGVEGLDGVAQRPRGSRQTFRPTILRATEGALVPSGAIELTQTCCVLSPLRVTINALWRSLANCSSAVSVFCVWRWDAWSVEAKINVTCEYSQFQAVLGMPLFMQVQSGEPKFLTAGMRGVMDEGTDEQQAEDVYCHALQRTLWCFCGSIASHMRGAIDDPRRRAKRNKVLLPAPKMLSWPVEVKVPRYWPRRGKCSCHIYWDWLYFSARTVSTVSTVSIRVLAVS
jgi:hypothetical protein